MFSRPVTSAVRASSTSLKTLFRVPTTSAKATSGPAAVVARALPVQSLQTSAVASAVGGRKKPCGKCVRCSCHDRLPTTGAAVKAGPAVTASGAGMVFSKRRQSTALHPQSAPMRPRFEPHDDGRPAWITDPNCPTGKAAISAYAVNTEGKRWLEVNWEDGERGQFPFLWLRDNCTCSDCFHPTTLSRRFLMKNLDVDITADNVKVDSATGEIFIDWSDGHKSVYPFSWLEGRSFNEKARSQRARWMPRPHIYWGQEMQDRIPSDTFENIMTDDYALYRWMNTLEQTGLFRLQGAPVEEGQLDKLGERVAFLKPTHFGSLWEVITRDNPSNLQYTTATLGLHIDLTYYDYTPGVQLLHCIKQAKSEGGDNQFCDGFHIAERMRTEQPENFKLLTEVLIDHYDLGEESTGQRFFKLQRQPVIRHDREGRYDRITYNNMVRDSVLGLPVDKVNALYKAMKAFDDMLHDYQSHIVYKMEPGDIICFHNYRVLHGRSGYRALEKGDRHLQGGFFDWDEVYSRRRVLQMALGISD